MKLHFTSFVFVAVLLIPFSSGSAQTQSEETSYVLLVEPADQKSTTHVEFKGAYESHDANTSSKLTFIEDKTPFELKVSGTHFLGMFQSVSEKEKIKVTLKKYERGRLTNEASGSSPLNFIYSNPDEIGYGLPTHLLGDLRILEDRLNSRQ